MTEEVTKVSQIDVIGDLPDSIRAKIPSKEGKEIFIAAYNAAYSNGATLEVCFAKGWSAITAAGYSPDEQGEWRPMHEQQEESMFKRLLERFKKEEEEEVEKEEEEVLDFTLDAEITKFDEDQRLIYGWASVIEEDGKVVVDKQGDMIAETDLVEAAHDYMLESREAHEMHQGEKKGYTVESMVFTKQVQNALGIDLKKVGWFIVQKIEDDDTWNDVKAGKLKSFSVGGKGKRIPVA